MKVFVEFVGSVFFVDLKLSQNPFRPTTGGGGRGDHSRASLMHLQVHSRKNTDYFVVYHRATSKFFFSIIVKSYEVLSLVLFPATSGKKSWPTFRPRLKNRPHVFFPLLFSNFK